MEDADDITVPVLLMLELTVAMGVAIWFDVGSEFELPPVELKTAAPITIMIAMPIRSM